MITKSPTIKDIFDKHIYFTRSARIAFSYILKLLNFMEHDELLIPAYIGYTDREGSGVLDPIIENKVKYKFYPIKKNFNLDLNALEKLLSKSSVKGMLLIHYFGLLHCDILKIQELCIKHNVLLIEDCAHTLYTKYQNKYLGEFGDFSFYSLHKVLSVEEGGCFKINNKQYINDSTISVKDTDKASIQTLEILLSYDEKNAQKRVLANYKYMVKKLSEIEGIEIIVPDVSEETFPMNLPIFVTGIKRETFYFKMIEEGITLIALYYRLIDTIDKNSFPESHCISNSIINLPINQDICVEEMNMIVSITKKILKENDEY